jgi:predicted component of type VI protein secretion system
MVTKLYLNVIEPSNIPTEERSRVVEKTNYRIGRDVDNDWVIVSPNRLISRQHCVIELINNSCTITDLSKNGVFINNSPTPLGRETIGIINDGDVISLPGFKILVSFSETKTKNFSDPFLALLPPRGKEVMPPKAPQDPLIIGTANNPNRSLRSYDESQSQLNLSPRAVEFTSPFGNKQATPRSSSLNLERLPPQMEGFRSALPQSRAIPEDWDKDLDSLSSPSPPGPPQIKSRMASNDATKTILLRRLIQGLSKVQNVIDDTNTNQIALLLAEENISRLNQNQIEITLKLIDELYSKLIHEIMNLRQNSKNANLLNNIISKENSADTHRETISIPTDDEL